jgi:two-component system sensor histidine kinase YesM
MNAVDHDDDSTAELTFLLAEQMRSSIDKVGKMVSLSREIETIRQYLTFIDIRYDHSFTWDITMPDPLADAQVPSLMLQPIVENAIIHGLKPKGRGELKIIIEQQKNELRIRVVDNGVGMDEDTVRDLERRLRSDYDHAEETDSIGLKNVHDRLRYTFGEQYGISIDSAPEKGTAILILLLLIFNGGDDV